MPPSRSIAAAMPRAGTADLEEAARRGRRPSGRARGAMEWIAGTPSFAPLVGLLLLAALVRLPTLGLQSFWFDEAFTPVHVLHPSLLATMRTLAHTENTPPLWYVI